MGKRGLCNVISFIFPVFNAKPVLTKITGAFSNS